MKKNLFLTFCFSFIPGAGQMYQSYMKRGISIMIIFAISIAIFAMVNMPVFAIPIPLILAFSFFDTYNIRNKIGSDNQIKDEYVLSCTYLEKIGFNFDKKNNFVAAIFIFIGIYVLFNNVFLSIASRYDIVILKTILKTVSTYLPSLIIAILSIYVGIKFIGKKEK